MTDSNKATNNTTNGSGDPVQDFFEMEKEERRKAFSDMENSERMTLIKDGLEKIADMSQGESSSILAAFADIPDDMMDKNLENIAGVFIRYLRFVISQVRKGDVPKEFLIWTFFGDFLQPFVDAELKKPEYDGKSINELYQEMEVLPPYQRGDSRFSQAVKAADEAYSRKDLPRVTYKKMPGLEISLDKLARDPFSPIHLSPEELAKMEDEELSEEPKYIPLGYENNHGPELTLYYSYELDKKKMESLGLEIAQKLDDEDFFILSFIANFWRAGIKIISVTKLYREMTGAEPNTKEKTKLADRLNKLASIRFYIDDRQIREAWGMDTYRTYEGYLAPIEIATERFIASGRVSKASVRILGEPAIMRLGREIGQYTTIPKKLLHVKDKDGRNYAKTDRFYRVLHYLIRRIAGAKNGTLSNKILYNTFYEELGETTASGRRNALKTMYVILDYFKKCEWITRYREHTTPSTGEVGVKVFFDSKCVEKARKKRS